MSDATALITAIASLIVAIGGLITALLPMIKAWLERRGPGPDRPDDTDPPTEQKVSERTRNSLTCGVIASVIAVGLSLSQAGTGRLGGLAYVLLTLVAVVTWVGASLGVYRAYDAWRERDLGLTLNATLGTVVGLVAWVSALISTAPLWR